LSDYNTIARYYDIEHRALTEDLPMYESFARRCGSPVLELGCGAGRVALHLARAGFRVVGVDDSPAMLALARRKLVRAGLAGQVHLLAADLADFALAERFALATLTINTFMHFVTAADQLRVLRNARRHLLPGGTLVIDLPHADEASPAEADEPFAVDQFLTDPKTGQVILKRATVRPDAAAQTRRIALVYQEIDAEGKSRRTTASFKVHVFHRREVAHLLERTGFCPEAMYGDYDLGPHHDDSERMIFVARRATA
jgi:SAM-dependent methyltransferase